MVKGFEDGLSLIEKWLRNKNTIEFIGIWERINNPDFNSPEFEGIKNEAGLNRFTLSVKKRIQKTNAVGIIAKTGRYDGTFAHKYIAFEFGSRLSPEFKLNIQILPGEICLKILELQKEGSRRMKTEEFLRGHCF